MFGFTVSEYVGTIMQGMFFQLIIEVAALLFPSDYEGEEVKRNLRENGMGIVCLFLISSWFHRGGYWSIMISLHAMFMGSCLFRILINALWRIFRKPHTAFSHDDGRTFVCRTCSFRAEIKDLPSSRRDVQPIVSDVGKIGVLHECRTVSPTRVGRLADDLMYTWRMVTYGVIRGVLVASFGTGLTLLTMLRDAGVPGIVAASFFEVMLLWYYYTMALIFSSPAVLSLCMLLFFMMMVEWGMRYGLRYFRRRPSIKNVTARP